MHSDRSCPVALRARWPKDPPARSLASCGHIAARVVGLGAPVSVRIRLTAIEIPVLRGEIVKRLDAQIQRGDSQRETKDNAFAGNERAWLEMLAQLDSGRADAETHVLWPTAYADLALRDALIQALIGVRSASSDDDGLPQLAEALATTQALLATLTAFRDIDRGGLLDVDL
jgi:hypothetical protein